MLMAAMAIGPAAADAALIVDGEGIGDGRMRRITTRSIVARIDRLLASSAVAAP